MRVARTTSRTSISTYTSSSARARPGLLKNFRNFKKHLFAFCLLALLCCPTALGLSELQLRQGGGGEHLAIVHAKLRRSQLIELTRRSKQTGLLQVRSGAIDLSAIPGAQISQAAEQQLVLETATKEVDNALRNNEAEGSMLQTQTLSSDQSLFVVKKMADTIQRMKQQVALLEEHYELCRKRLSDIKQEE
mmetsp:Transcript_20751/g.30896  ORF Transcript_20751/g.30896 Transcript_20751/m.30896 type:complete len:191 (-) Transcript_20751:209-781(-)|eukprot:CAMPEP_0206478048 /NCGR_PEP_ID=MMETSP0324_2-20121206/35803_1 /ASSEMBLY_ACC=CAM_ASM_000836 /TAXON_ID=2866 /ORGANISM="Crypthecodinium cohnii, Strain Seligo" /LENGTH=190 /DNA_ID=CAMNT_0053954243 /DNA_START=26 /DNA_END=598 /DNA_ORIENTATION=+